MGELFEDLLEVGLGVEAPAFAVLNNGVNGRTHVTGFGTAEKEPVFHAELGRTHGVLDQVVVDLDVAVTQVLELLLPLAEGVAECLAQRVLGKVAVVQDADDFLKAFVDGRTLVRPNSITKVGSRPVACVAFPRSGKGGR